LIFKPLQQIKTPMGLFQKPLRGFSKEENSIQIISPMGFSSRAYRYNECYINIKDKGI
jgi:hypothetical protein